MYTKDDKSVRPVVRKGSWRVLHLEDSAPDAELVKALLREQKVAVDITWVRTRGDFTMALEREVFDVILSDYTVPGFSGVSALELARKKAVGCPVIFLSGTLGEEAAVEAMKKGATDFVPKDRPGRLGVAIDRAVRESEEQRQRLHAEEALKHSYDELRALAARLQDAREEERMRISREMHDGMGELLTGIEMGLSWLRVLLDKSPLGESKRELLGKIEEIRVLTKDTAGRVRKLCTELRPSILDDVGLIPALEWQVKEFQTRTKIRCETDFPEEELPVKTEQATAVFRIFQELLTNVARHAEASKVHVHLIRNGHRLLLEVKDNGRGIKPEQLSGTGSLGLLGMKERAMLLGGTVEIAGHLGKGTTVMLNIPLR